MFDRDPANIPFRVQIKQGVLVQIPGLGNLSGPKLDVERVGVLEVADFHGLNVRSKKALCTVSPSGNSITRKYFPSISAMGPNAGCGHLLESLHALDWRRRVRSIPDVSRRDPAVLALLGNNV